MDGTAGGEVRPRDAGGASSVFGECSTEVVPPLVSPWGSVGRMLTLGVVSAFSKFVVSWMNRATVSNYDVLHRHMTERHRPQGLITVSNHASTFDDPGVLSFLIPFRYFMTEPTHGGVRWTMCTKEICASSAMIHQFFTAGKTVPITRGGGINQAVMTTMAERVSKGDWLHIFPEGRVSKDGKLGRLKWGLGKMLCDVEAMVRGHTGKRGRGDVGVDVEGGFYMTWHDNIIGKWNMGNDDKLRGMEQVKPYGVGMLYPFNHVHVTVGEPVDFSDLVGRCRKCRDDKQREELFRTMVARVEESMRETRVRNLKEREVM